MMPAIGSWNNRENTAHLRDGLAMIQTVREDAQRERLHSFDGLRAGLPIGQDTRNGRHVRQSTPIVFLLDFDR